MELREEEDIFEELDGLLAEKSFAKLHEVLREYNPIDVACWMDELPTVDAILVFRLLHKDDAAEIFTELDPEIQEEIVHASTEKEMKYIVDELYLDDMVDLIEEMPANVVKKILSHTNPEERKLINSFLRYPEDSAGSIMTIEFVELKATMTAREALNIIKRTGIDKVTVYTCYVTNREKKLIGYVSLRMIVTSDDDVLVEDLIQEDVICVNTRDDQEVVADIFRKYGFVALPVVDDEGRMTGIITVDDIMDIMEQETTEDFQKMAAMNPSEEEYLDTSVVLLAKNRIVWLVILMITSTVTGEIIASYDGLIQSVMALNIFVPLVMSTGGNSGNQASTLIIRGIATGEIVMKDWVKVAWKEFRISLLVGIVLAVVNFFKCIYIDQVTPDIAIIVSITVIFTVVLAKFIGGMLPLVAKRLKLDPAIMAGPLITTMVDALSLTIYFKIASLFFVF